MKKSLLALGMMLCTMGASAQQSKTFTDYLVVTINGESTDPQAADIVVTVREDGKMDFNLKNFKLGAKEVSEDGDIISVFLPVGNISLDGLELTPVEGTKNYTFQADQNLTIQEGDIEGETWLGPMLGEIPIKMNGTICNEKLYVTIDIDMQSTLGQNIYVMVGTPIDNTPLSPTPKTYTDYLVITVNGQSTDPQAADIEVAVDADGKMDFNLKNFCLASKEVTDDQEIVNVLMPVGNITLKGLTLTPVEGTNNYTFQAEENLVIQPGDMELGEGEMWIGPLLEEIPIKMSGVICDKKLYVTIDIDMMSSLGQIIYVKAGTPIDNTILFPEEVEPTIYTITFVIDGQTVSTLEVEEGAAVTAPYVAAREGYTFAWTDEVPATATADVTINGAYTVNQYTLKVVDVNTGETIYEALIDFGTEIQLPTMEEREGYTFEWVGEIPKEMPANEVTLKGVYMANHYTCIWILDGEKYEEMSIPYGETVPDVTVENDERYTFNGWDNVPETMPAHDVTINGNRTDGIRIMKSEELRMKNAYNLAGQRVNATNARGIVIVNGKKVVK